jgi:hypothetical protein
MSHIGFPQTVSRLLRNVRFWKASNQAGSRQDEQSRPETRKPVDVLDEPKKVRTLAEMEARFEKLRPAFEADLEARRAEEDRQAAKMGGGITAEELRELLPVMFPESKILEGDDSFTIFHECGVTSDIPKGA